MGVELFFADRKGQNAGLIVRVDKPGIGADQFRRLRSLAGRGTADVAAGATSQQLRADQGRPVRGGGRPLDPARGQARRLESIEIFVDGKSVLRHDDGEKALPAGAVGLRGWHCQASYRNLWVKTGKEVESLAFKQPEPVPEISGMWRAVQRGTAAGRFGLVTETPVCRHAVAADHLRFRRRANGASRTRGSIAGA